MTIRFNAPKDKYIRVQRVDKLSSLLYIYCIVISMMIHSFYFDCYSMPFSFDEISKDDVAYE